MMDDDYGRWGLGAAMVALACVMYMATCSTADAAPYEVHFQNPGTTRPYDVLAVCRASGCAELPVSCAHGATCSAMADLPIGTHAVWLLGGQGAERSPASNVREITVAGPPPFDPAACLALDACRFDADGSGSVTVLDFGRFLGALGSTWP